MNETQRQRLAATLISTPRNLNTPFSADWAARGPDAAPDRAIAGVRGFYVLLQVDYQAFVD